MITELFYSKELKGIIADLRAKDDLNEEALKKVKIPWVFAVLLWFIIMPYIYFKFTQGSIESLLISGLISAVLIIFILLIEQSLTIRQAKAYLNGELRNAKVTHIYSHVPLGNIWIRILDSKNATKVKLGPFWTWKNKEYRPKMNEDISYYSNGSGWCNNMPNRMEIKKEICLSKSKLQDDCA